MSPYRATIQVTSSSAQFYAAQPNNANGSDDAESNDEEGDFERDGTLTQQFTEVNRSISPMTAYKQMRQSPIKSDSQPLRNERDEFLQSFRQDA